MCAGTIGGYFVYALAGQTLGLVRASSHLIYAAIAIALVVAGCSMLAGSGHRCAPVSRGSNRGMFAFGVASALSFSPCCTPIALALGMQASLGPNAILAAEALAAFGLGHVLPLVGLAGALGLAHRQRILALEAPGALAGGTILIGVGLLYGVLV